MTLESAQSRLDYMSIIYGLANGSIEDEHDCKLNPDDSCKVCEDIALAQEELLAISRQDLKDQMAEDNYREQKNEIF